MISKRVTRAVCTAATAAGLLMTGLAGPASAASIGRGTSTASAVGYRTFSGRLYSVAASSASNVWAAGLHPNSSLIVRWTGKTWIQSFSSTLGYFNGIGTDSPTDVWAVGATNWFSPSHTLIEHYNGSTWTRVPSPSPGGGGYLNAVTAISATDAWAVGLIGPGGNGVPGATTPLIEHWNGTTWTHVPCPIPATGGQFYAVSATSPTDVWAVGQTGGDASASGQQGLIEHWNGTAWTRVPSPSPTGATTILRGVSATAPGSIWVVGYVHTSGGADSTLVLRWQHGTWTRVPSPTPTGDAELQAVSATSGTDAWAVGLTRPDSCGPRCGSLIEHWNGTAWSQVPSPNPPATPCTAFR